MADFAEDDPRVMELETLQAIYPEVVMDPTDAFSFTLELPVTPEQPVRFAFPAAGDDATPADISTLAYLPPVRIAMSLPTGYPEDKPPTVALSTTPDWLPADVLPALQSACATLWEEIGRDQVVYAYVAHVQEAAQAVFGLTGAASTPPQSTIINSAHRLALLDYDAKEQRAAFERKSFDCGVCLDRKLGALCHRMQDCGHVFCVQCLQDFYTDAITNGALATVRCLEPKCAKTREEARAANANAAGTQAGGGQPQQIRISPGELRQIPLDEQVVKRYVDLSYKTALEADKNVVYCPRTWCDGVARRSAGASPSDDETDDKDKDLLCICDTCRLAFCSRCYQTWHGPLVLCRPRLANGELTEEDKATLAYMARNTTPCCTCDAPAQKTTGCNHMICARCNTHFCYLCSAWLDPANPYKHYGEGPNGHRTSCFGRLWENRDENADGVVYDAHLDPVEEEEGEDNFDPRNFDFDDEDEGEDDNDDDDGDSDSDSDSDDDFDSDDEDFDDFFPDFVEDDVDAEHLLFGPDFDGLADEHDRDAQYMLWRIAQARDARNADDEDAWQARLDVLHRARRDRLLDQRRRARRDQWRDQAALHEQRMHARQEGRRQAAANAEVARRRRAVEEADRAAAAAQPPQIVNVALEGPLVMRIGVQRQQQQQQPAPNPAQINGGGGGGRGGRGARGGRGGVRGRGR